MKTKLLFLLFVVLCATAPVPAAPIASKPRVIIVVDYAPGSERGQHIFFGVREYLRYFFPCFWRCIP